MFSGGRAAANDLRNESNSRASTQTSVESVKLSVIAMFSHKKNLNARVPFKNLMLL